MSDPEIQMGSDRHDIDSFRAELRRDETKFVMGSIHVGATWAPRGGRESMLTENRATLQSSKIRHFGPRLVHGELVEPAKARAISPLLCLYFMRLAWLRGPTTILICS
jgi:hypothetical protein